MGKAIEGTFWVNGKKIRKPVYLQERRCEECGEWFDPPKMISRYCSRKCGKAAEAKRNAEKYKAASKERYRANKDKISQKRKEYYWSNPELFRAKSRNYRRDNPVKARKTDKEQKDKARFDGLREDAFKGVNSCIQCGSRENLVVHHQDHNPKHNDAANFSVLCRSCHLKLHDPLSYRWGKRRKTK